MCWHLAQRSDIRFCVSDQVQPGDSASVQRQYPFLRLLPSDHGGRVDGVALLVQRFAVEVAVIVHGNAAGAAVEPADVRRGLARDDIPCRIAVDVHAVRQPRKLPVCRFFLPSTGANARNAQTWASQRMPRFFLAFFSFPSGSAACPRADML